LVDLIDFELVDWIGMNVVFFNCMVDWIILLMMDFDWELLVCEFGIEDVWLVFVELFI